MAKRRGGIGGGLGLLGTARSMISILKEMSFDDVRDDAERAPRLLILAPTVEDARILADLLSGERRAGVVDPRVDSPSPSDLTSYDALVVHGPQGGALADRLREQLDGRNGGSPVFRSEGEVPLDPKQLDGLRQRMMERLPDRAPAFGRAFLAFRPPAAKAVIDETAKANAQFALVSNIPAVVPLVGGLMAASADFLVLTKNQLMLLYKIAAIHGRDLGDQFGIIREMVPVVGAGLAWRTVAREAASFVPFAAGTIPKVAIAYAGTLSVGRAADFYYRFGRKPDRAQVKEYYRQAVERVRALPFGASSNNGPTSVTIDARGAQERESEPAAIG